MDWKKIFGGAALAAGLMIGGTANAAPVLVNEINAGGATQAGDWFEVVVVGDGTAGSTVDMRGWSFSISEDDGGQTVKGFFTLTNDSYWSDVVAGTILTFHEDDTAGGGADTAIQSVNNLATDGWAWTNIFVGDSTYIETGAGDYDGSFPIANDDSQIEILDNLDVTVFGPAGEGHAGYVGGGVNGSEVFKLEADPSTSITLTSNYNDGSSSTFGAPNEWNGGSNVQNFSAFVIPEPASLVLLGLGAVSILGRRRSK